MPIRNRHHAFLGFLAWLGFVIYGSLLPFQLRGISLNEAIHTFFNIQFLDLGIVSRADWIANILLYIPLSFLACSWLGNKHRPSVAGALIIPPALLFCIGTAVGIEFVQTFYAPRTVSLNDLLAESIGSLLGIILWFSYRTTIRNLLDAFANGGKSSVFAAIALYGIVYFLLALFPFDFIISLNELKWKLSSNLIGWILASNCESWLRCSAQLLGEALAIAPLGLLLALASPRISLRRLFIAGAAFSLILELLQLLLASGTTQGASILIRGGGLVAGAMLGRYLYHDGLDTITGIIRRSTIFLAPPYLLAVVALNSWFSGPWVDPGTALARLSEVRLLPFFYHYFSTETHAVASLLAQCAMYAPIGIVLWARDAKHKKWAPRNLATIGLSAAFVAFPIEFGKLMVPPMHPDFTNLLIAAFGAMTAYWLARWVGSIDDSPHAPFVDATATDRYQLANHVDGRQPNPIRPFGIAISLAGLIGLILGATSFPLYQFLLTAFLIGYAILLYRHPWLWLFILPIALPILDLSPLTGRLLLDGFDLLVLVTVSVGYWIIYPSKPRSWPRRSLALAVVILWSSWLLAFGRGIWPLLDVSSAVVASSHTPLEAWLVGKGLLWSLLLAPLLRRLPRDRTEFGQRLLIQGVVVGLAIEVVIVAWERHVFVGLTNFENIFRVTGTFASMHTGGAYIEAYLAFTFPILLVWVMRQHHWGPRIVGLALAGASVYAMSVTYSRGGYAGLVVSLVIVTIGVLIQRHRVLPGGKLVLAGSLLTVFAIGLPVISGEFAQYRLNRSIEDLNIRLAHWRQAVNIMDDGPTTALIGMGFGRYPTQYLYGARSGIPTGNFSIVKDGDGTVLHLNPGDALYLDQVVPIDPYMHYTLSARIRHPLAKGQLSIPICEKALLYSFACDWYQISSDKPGQWQTITTQIDNVQLSSKDHWPRGPIKLSLYNPSKNDPIEVSWISLKDRDGRELLANGDFEKGADRWLFVTDRDLAWHIHQQEVETYFAQGVLGLLALALLIFSVGRILRRGIVMGCTFALAMAAALAGFLTVGLLGSTVDTARLSMLFYFGALAGGLLTDKGRRRYPFPGTHTRHPGFPSAHR